MAKKRVIESEEEAYTRKTSNKLSTRAKRAKFDNSFIKIIKVIF